MFNVVIQIVTPTTTHCGVGHCRSPKQATLAALREASRKLHRRGCESVGIEWMVVLRDGKVVASKEVYTDHVWELVSDYPGIAVVSDDSL